MTRSDLPAPSKTNEAQPAIPSHGREGTSAAAAARANADPGPGKRAGEQTLNARDKLIHILECIPNGFIGVDAAWRVTYVNSQTEKLTGIRREEMTGRTYWDVFPAVRGTIVERELRRAVEEGEPVDFEMHSEDDCRMHLKACPADDGGLSIFIDDVTEQWRAAAERQTLLARERDAREEAEELLEVSRQLGGELDLQKLVQVATDAATKLTGAEFGAFFYNVLDERGESYMLYTLSGAPREAFDKMGLPRNTAVFDPTFRGTGIVRSDDILQDPNYGKNAPHNGIPAGHLPVRSYLAVPVIGRSGEVLGGLFFAHSKTAIFTDRAERMASGIAGHTAIAIDNARLFSKAEQEIAHRKKYEKAARENEAAFRAMIDALPAAIYTTDAEGRLTHFNPAAVKFSGRVPELGTDQWCVTWKLFTADGTPLPHDDCPMAVALNGGSIVSGAECIAERPDGTRVWFSPYPTPLRDEHGRITGGINMLVDITERKNAEEALRRSEERFRGVFECSAIGVAILDLDGRFIQVNQAFSNVTGYSEEELRAYDCCALTHPDDCDATRTEIQKLVSGESPAVTIVKRYFTKDGRTIWVQNSISAMRDAAGHPEHLIAVCEDITARRDAETAMRDSEERFRAIVDASPECVKIIDAEGTVLHMNTAGLDIVGAPSAEAVVGQSIYNLIAPEFHQAFRDFNAKICAGEKGSLQFDIIGLTRQRRQMETYAVPFRNPDGRVVHLGLTRDITERTRAERATLLLGAIVDSSDDAIVSKDLTGIITSWNKGAERLFGYTADEVVGKSITILIPPDRLTEEPEILRRLQRGDRVEHFETIRRRKDGTLLNISLTISPVKDRTGRVIGASKIARDITDRKRAEIAVRESEGRFRQLADSMPQIVWTATPDGSLDYYNKRWYDFTGRADSAVAEIWSRILHPDDLQRILDAWHTCVQTGEPFRAEFRFWDRRDNRWRWFLGRALAVRDDKGNIIKWFGTSTDIDEQKHVEDELRRANQDLEQFAYSASHDLQEPLRGVKIFSELLTKRYADQLNGDALEYLGFLRSSASRMEMLVRDLLAYTQVSRFELPGHETDADRVLQETVETLNGSIVETGAQVTSDRLPSLHVHEAHLRQLFQNLIGNAIKYHSPDRVPTVHVSASKLNASWVFSVSDNGIGIAPEYHNRIFGLFKRLHSAEQYSGTGIGLAICQRIVERYHGRIWVESKPGEGSTFRFSLPA